MALARFEAGLHNKKNTAHLVPLDKLLAFTSYRRNKIAVEIMHRANRALKLVGVNRYVITGRHRLGYACRRLHGENLLLAPGFKTVNPTILLPVLYKSRSLLCLHIKPRQRKEVICTDLNGGALAALKAEMQMEAVVNLIGGYIVKLAINRANSLGNKLKHLVYKVNAPVKHHSAALGLVTAPVGGDAA